MANIAASKAKLAAKIPHMPANYNRSMGEFFGVGEGAIAASGPGKAYSVKIRPGVENTWERNLKQAFGL